MGCAESREQIIVAKNTERLPTEENLPSPKANKQAIRTEPTNLEPSESADKENCHPKFSRKKTREWTIGPFIQVNDSYNVTPQHEVYAPLFDSPVKRRIHRILTNDSIPDFNSEVNPAARYLSLYRADSTLESLEEEI